MSEASSAGVTEASADVPASAPPAAAPSLLCPEEPDRKSSMTNSEFIVLLFFVTLRLAVYGAITVAFLIFHQGKSIDPVGYRRILNALTFTHQKSGINIASFISVKEEFTDTAPSKLRAEESIVPPCDKSQEYPVYQEIKLQRQELLKLTLQCHRLEEKLGISHSQCNRQHLSIHEAVLNNELELNSRPSHQILLTLIKQINDEIFQETEPEHSSTLDHVENTSITEHSIELLSKLQNKVLNLLQIDHDAILQSRNTNDSNLFIDAAIEDTVNERVFKVLNGYKITE